jgi:hypothetical protein
LTVYFVAAHERTRVKLFAAGPGSSDEVIHTTAKVAYAALINDLVWRGGCREVGLDTEGVHEGYPLMIQLAGPHVVVVEMMQHTRSTPFHKLSPEACDLLASPTIRKLVFGKDVDLLTGLCDVANFKNMQDCFVSAENASNDVGLAAAVSACSGEAWRKENIYETYRPACSATHSTALLKLARFGFYAVGDAWFTCWLGELVDAMHDQCH